MTVEERAHVDLYSMAGGLDFILSTVGGIMAADGQNVICGFKRWSWARVEGELASFHSGPVLGLSLESQGPGLGRSRIGS